jgi:O-antigen/teichoic acid export membrane protein
MLLPFFSFYLTKSDLGIYDLVVTTVAMLIPFVTLQISNGAYRWLLGLDKIEYVLTKKIITSSFIVISTGLFSFVIIFNLASIFYDSRYLLYLIFLVITSSYLPYFQIVLRGFKETKLFAISGLLNAFLLVIFNLTFLLVFDFGISGLFIATIASNIITIIFILFKGGIIKYLDHKCFSRKISKEMLTFSIPLVPNVISWWLVNSADKFLILYFLNSEMNGIYAISSRFPTIITLVNSIFLLAWQDHSIINKDNNDEKVEFDSKIFNAFVNFEFSIVFILIAVSELTVRFLVAPEFYESYKYMPLLYIGVAFSAFSGYFGAAFISAKKTKVIFTSSVICGIINLLVCFLLVKYIGLYASVLGTFVSYLIMFIIRVNQSKGFYKININIKRLVFFTLLALVFSFLILVNNMILTILLIISSILISIKLNISFLNKIKRKFLH